MKNAMPPKIIRMRTARRKEKGKRKKIRDKKRENVRIREARPGRQIKTKYGVDSSMLPLTLT